MSNISNDLYNINSIVSHSFPKINKSYIVYSSIDNQYTDRFYPVNNYLVDKFIEFRIPKTTSGVFTDLSESNINFNLSIEKTQYTTGSVWSPKKIQNQEII